MASLNIDNTDGVPPNPAVLRVRLQSLLDAKERQLQQAGTLGQRVLAQQMELEHRVRDLYQRTAGHEEEDDSPSGSATDLEPEAIELYRQLAATIREWEEENKAFGRQTGLELDGAQEVPTNPAQGVKVGTAEQSRRAKNAAHRADDVEFAFEIGSGLLTEVRRLQDLLGLRDKAIQDMKEEQDDLEKSLESVRTALRQQETSADKFKEENWNLEVTLQELRASLSNLQEELLKAETEKKRLVAELVNTQPHPERQREFAEVGLETHLGYRNMEIQVEHENIQIDISRASSLAPNTPEGGLEGSILSNTRHANISHSNFTAAKDVYNVSIAPLDQERLEVLSAEVRALKDERDQLQSQLKAVQELEKDRVRRQGIFSASRPNPSEAKLTQHEKPSDVKGPKRILRKLFCLQ
ncbi:hypothetical protein FA15DRAFT_648858 [Coprinopsis marcescibilis]|uniref:Uncharacterized protein n=1 Tax=Coprinopsis marcescibilis TaxID=230819 RepID=A0A5C3KGQ9_COPMA|nr:hypothetical protein FA15DRAFT_648858 [Coprinopsis marcescibilis]